MIWLAQLCVISISTSVPEIALSNAADEDLRIPVIGLGTASMNTQNAEIWDYNTSQIYAQQWYNLGGKRYDSSDDYPSNGGIAQGILSVTENWTKSPRSSVFIVSKIGPTTSLGFNDSIIEFEGVLKMFNTDYIDLLLIHWPSDNQSIAAHQAIDPYCNPLHKHKYSPKACRQSTWRGLQYIYNGYNREQDNKFVRAKAIGVSNFEQNHLNDIIELNELLPALNQIEFHGYWHEYQLVNYCQSYNITVCSYCPLGMLCMCDLCAVEENGCCICFRNTGLDE